MVFQQQPVRRVDVDPPRDAPALDADAWPMTVPAVAQLARGGLPLRPGVTFLVGENGSGKSTVVEAIAEAYGLPAEGGSPNGGATTRRSESPLGAHLHLERSAGAPRWGFFLRAETMHGWYTFSEQSGGGPAYHELSHGESFLEVLRTRFDTPGFYCLDEPEAALSFSATLGLVARLAELAAAGAQIVCATHSPVLAALPGAHILELGSWGMREAAWDDLELVEHWRAYLAHPQRYLRHVLSDD